MKVKKMNIITIYQELSNYYCFQDFVTHWYVNQRNEIVNIIGFKVGSELVKIQHIDEEVFFNHSVVTSFEDIAIKIQYIIDFKTEIRMKPLLTEHYKEFLTKYLQNKS